VAVPLHALAVLPHVVPPRRRMIRRAPDPLHALSKHRVGMEPRVVGPPRAVGARLVRHREGDHLRPAAVLARSEFRHVAHLHRPEEVPRHRLVGVEDHAHVVHAHAIHLPPMYRPLPLEILPIHPVEPDPPLVVVAYHRVFVQCVHVAIDAHPRPRSEEPAELFQLRRVVVRVLPIPRFEGLGGVALDVGHGVEDVVRLRAHRAQHLDGIVREQRSREEATTASHPPGRREGQIVPVPGAPLPLLLDVQYDAIVVVGRSPPRTAFGSESWSSSRAPPPRASTTTTIEEEEEEEEEEDALLPSYSSDRRRRRRREEGGSGARVVPSSAAAAEEEEEENDDGGWRRRGLPTTTATAAAIRDYSTTRRPEGGGPVSRRTGIITRSGLFAMPSTDDVGPSFALLR